MEHGTAWSKLVDLGRPVAANVYGAIAPISNGVLSLAYIRGTNENPSTQQPWYAEMARVRAADTPSPVVDRARPLAKPIHLKDICFDGIACGLPGFGNDRNLLDFIWVGVAPNGQSFGIFASDGPATGSSNDQTPDVLVLRQTGSAVHVVAARRAPEVLGTKQTRVTRRLAATGVGGAPTVAVVALLALAALTAAPLVRRR